MTKVVSVQEALDHIKPGMTIMLGGFFWSGSPFVLIRELTKRAGSLHDLTLISNDAGSEFMHDESLGNALLETGMFKKCIASFIGHNKPAMRLIAEGKMELETLPMGTFAECIRAGGAGIGGFLTPTGVGTPVARGKQVVDVDGMEYLLEKPLRADVALIFGNEADECGNVWNKGVARNFNVHMATAADYVIVETPTVLRSGEMDPNMVSIPAPYVDAIVKSEEGDYIL